MELMNEFEVDVPVDDTWAVLTDLRRLAPCVPGARLHDLDDGELRGVLDVKVGPIDATYEARSAFVDLDGDEHTVVLSVTGHDTHGQGDATASITLDLEPKGDRTLVSVVADLSVSGKVAQFGRTALAEVGTELMRRFVDNLVSEVSGGGSTPTTAEPTGSVVATAAAARGAREPGVRAPEGSGAVPAPSRPTDPSPPARGLVIAGAFGLVLLAVLGVALRRRVTRER